MDLETIKKLVEKNQVTYTGLLDSEKVQEMTEAEFKRRYVTLTGLNNDTEEPEELPTVEEVLTELKAGGDVVLPMDLNITSKIALAKPTNLDLNGKTIKNETPGGDAIQLGGGDFAFSNGTIDNEIGGAGYAGVYMNSSKGNNVVLENMTIRASYPVYLNNAVNPNLTIKSGTYIAPFDKGVAVYVEKGGHVTIEGGLFTTEGRDSSFLLNLKDAIRTPNTDKKPVEFIEVKGGTFVNFNPEDNAAEGPGTDFVAPGYIVGKYQKGDDTMYIVEKYNDHTDFNFDGPDGATVEYNVDKAKARMGLIEPVVEEPAEEKKEESDNDFEFLNNLADPKNTEEGISVDPVE